MNSTPTSADPFSKSNFGLCVVDLNAGSLYQNSACRSICNCVIKLANSPPKDRSCTILHCRGEFKGDGVFVLRSFHISATLHDVVFIREGEREYCFIYPLQKKLDAVQSQLSNLHLTRRELEIASLVLLSCSNLAIREKLNISQSTLRSHLKSINRKIPIEARKAFGFDKKRLN